MQTTYRLIKFEIPNPKTNRKSPTHILPTLNEYVNACRTSPYKGADMKKSAQRHIRAYLPDLKLTGRYIVKITWIEDSKKRDPDNIASAKKYILDAMQEAEILPRDGWQNIGGFVDVFEVGQESKVIIELQEVE